MSLRTAQNHRVMALDIDGLMQDSYLLVVELRQGASAHNSDQLWQRCVEQVERVRQDLAAAHVSQRSIELISHAQCALLDETMLGCAQGDAHARWAGEPLQAKFFNRHQAGEFFYADLREVLHQPAPDPLVLTTFQRVLMLGFRGRYPDNDDPEREQLLATLTARVAPLQLEHSLPSQLPAGRRLAWLWRDTSALVHLLMAAVVLGLVWWGLDQLLGNVIATLVPGQA
ncbi:type VI secretion system protein TssL, short form [Pseudomonas sp. IT-P176]|uniref:type VI secretion system protein TssL, short form n=1 Tax=Pseudomonas sp. IT-P176 TaxID=3026444 RepID=UPI0039DFEFA7